MDSDEQHLAPDQVERLQDLGELRMFDSLSDGPEYLRPVADAVICSVGNAISGGPENRKLFEANDFASMNRVHTSITCAGFHC